MIGLWLALLIGSEATGSRTPTNPIRADYELLTGHLEWPHGWANALVVIEVLLLVALIWFVRNLPLDRAQRSETE